MKSIPLSLSLSQPRMISKKECGLNPVVQESDDWVDDLEENGQQATNVEVGGIQCKATKTILLCPGIIELTVADCKNPIYIITLVFSTQRKLAAVFILMTFFKKEYQK